VREEKGGRPFVSIGVTTYNRHDLLRQTLDSILSQTFTDFEVIVGNDYTAELLSGEMLGISDPRIRFINHPRNLREVGNMNALLEMARGRYFTWLFDDDLYEPDFLRTAHNLLEQEDFPSALFPSHRVLRGGAPYRPAKIRPGKIVRLTGRDFLRGYFSSRLHVISTSGLFDTATLKKKIGGVEELCDSAIGLYCEYLFLVHCALLEKILYVDAPFVVFRAHPESWGDSNAELHKYLQGGERLVRRSAEVLRHPSLREDYDRNLLGVCKIHLSTFCFVAARVETSAGAGGIHAVSRALSRVLAEISRMRKTFLTEGGRRRLITQFRLAGIVAKCIYLVFFSFAYYGWRSRASRRKASPEGGKGSC
jgi:glycosyltransferase involved in cell wall biosynthesis